MEPLTERVYSIVLKDEINLEPERRAGGCQGLGDGGNGEPEGAHHKQETVILWHNGAIG